MNTEQRLAGEFQRLVDAEAAVQGAGSLLRVEVPAEGLVWRHAAGGVSIGGAPAVPTSPFRIASITKTFTAAVVAQMVHEGRMAFDDPVAQHLPPDHLDLLTQLHVFEGRSYGEVLTLRQLLTHSAGLFDYAMSESFFLEIAADPGRPWTPRRMLEGAIAWGAPHFAPDTGYGYAYSDTGYVLLGLAIEHVDGRTLHESYRARIIDPIGLAGTYLEGFEAHRGSETTHPHEGHIDTFPIHGSADWAGGGLVSDTDDLAEFATALVDGRVVAQPGLDAMLEYRFRTLDPSRHSPGFLGYGMGVEARDVGGVLLRGHRGHWGAWMHIDPATRVTITGTINQADRRPDRVVQGVVAALQVAGLVAGGPA